MNVWTWLAIGATALFGVSIIVGLAVARILGEIAQRASELLDEESWSSAPLVRASETYLDERPPELMREGEGSRASD